MQMKKAAETEETEGTEAGAENTNGLRCGTLARTPMPDRNTGERRWGELP